MNLRTGLAALAIATSGVAAHAQKAAKVMTKNDSIVNTVKSATQHGDSVATITFAQAKQMLGLGKKAPKGMVTVTRTRAAFQGKINSKNGLDGDFAYNTVSKMVRDPRLKPETKVTYGLGYVNSKVIGNAGTATAKVEKGNVNVRGDMFLGKKNDDVRGGLKLRAGYDYKLGSGFSAGPEVGLHTKMQKVNNDLHGYFAPELSGMAKFKHTFDNGVRVNAEAGAGAAAKLGYNNRTTGVGSIVPTARAEASVGYKALDFVVGGGKDVHLGKNANVGVRFTF